MESVLEKVRQRIQQLGLSWGEAAREIGVTEPSLRRHLEGAYVRSDSVAKYRRWLSGDKDRRTRQVELIPSSTQSDDDRPVLEPDLYDGPVPEGIGPYRVVDLFSGCGGLSLGFDLLENGAAFRTVLAVDIEDPMVRAYNANHPADTPHPICRKIDLSDFVTEAEVLALYLDHLAGVEGDDRLREQLSTIPIMGLRAFRHTISALDAEFIARLLEVREDSSFLDQYRELDSQVMNQTSVIGFHTSLKLPLTSTSRTPELGSIIWAHDPCTHQREAITQDDVTAALAAEIVGELEALWNREVEALRGRRQGRGRGQLASSSSRIAAFVKFLNTEAMDEVRDAWVQWRSRRDALRFRLFGDPAVLEALREIYDNGRRVSVVLGGPPCQGFSRIGRGKIRSLRDDRVHVHYDEDAGDARNRLLHKYVLFVSALAPDAFLFENVRHFQSKVQTPTGTYLATDVLAEAIRDISGDGPTYRVAQRIVVASDHLVPQTRERFFMLGLRAEVASEDTPAWGLALPIREQVPLGAALDGMPDPCFVNDRAGDVPPLARMFRREADLGSSPGARGEFRRWIEQSPPSTLPDREAGAFDAHCARPARPDDAGLFELMGPGKRWMDYRADESETVAELRGVLDTVTDLVRAARAQGADQSHPVLCRLAALGPERIQKVADKVDGSLPLRLLLEGIEPMPGELRHHLLTPNYLAKRDGKHGDWLARLHPDAPCKTIVTHMGKDTYAYVHPSQSRTISVREAARIQTFPDWFGLGDLSMVDAFRVIGNAVPPLLGSQFAERIARVLWTSQLRDRGEMEGSAVPSPVAAFA